MAFLKTEKGTEKVKTDEEKRAAHIQQMSADAHQREEDRRTAMKAATAKVEADARKKLLG